MAAAAVMVMGITMRFRKKPSMLAPDVLGQNAVDQSKSRHPKRPLTYNATRPLSPVLVDTALFQRVFVNVLENAHKYSLVKQIVETHGGTIHVQSQQGIGTTVTITLPVAPVDAAAVHL